MINNRQGGRRRGRGGQRGQGGQPGGNRQDNRQRGNAAQLLEKYKSMARDAQLSGDRVQTEYYLQYADHYFRVLGESRSRFEDQRPRRDDEDEDEGEDELAEAEFDSAQEDRSERAERQPRRDRQPRRNEGEDRPRRRAEQSDEHQFDRSDRDERDERPAPRRRSNGTDDASLPLSVLPPAIGRSEQSDEGDEEAPKPRRRARARPAAGDDEVAPVA